MPRRRIQVAALPWRGEGANIEILLVTSRISRHWLIPKGWPMKGMSNAEAAAAEAREEAGAIGVVASGPMGTYDYDKLREGRSTLPCRVEVYPLKVERFLGDWREKEQRSKEWFAPEAAADLVVEPDLARFIRDFARTYAMPFEGAERSTRSFGTGR